MHGDTAPGRLVAEPLLVLGVHLREIGHVDEEDIHLDHLPDGGPARFEDRFEVRDAGARLLRHAAGDQIPVAVGGELAGAVQLGRGADGLGLRGSVVEGKTRGRHGAYVGTGSWVQGGELVFAIRNVNWRLGVGIVRGQASLVKMGVKSDILMGEWWKDAAGIRPGCMRGVDERGLRAN